MPKLVSIDDQRYAALTLQSLRVTIDPLQASTTSLESQESYLTAGMLPYNRNVTLQTFLSSTRDFYRLHSTFARLYNAAASPASRLRSAGSLAINAWKPSTVFTKVANWYDMQFKYELKTLVCLCKMACLFSSSSQFKGNVVVLPVTVLGWPSELIWRCSLCKSSTAKTVTVSYLTKFVAVISRANKTAWKVYSWY